MRLFRIADLVDLMIALAGTRICPCCNGESRVELRITTNGLTAWCVPALNHHSGHAITPESLAAGNTTTQAEFIRVRSKLAAGSYLHELLCELQRLENEDPDPPDLPPDLVGLVEPAPAAPAEKGGES